MGPIKMRVNKLQVRTRHGTIVLNIVVISAYTHPSIDARRILYNSILSNDFVLPIHNTIKKHSG